MKLYSDAPLAEFIYTSLISSAEQGQTTSIPDLWSSSVSCILTNMAMFIALSGLSMLLPPWRSARAQVHTKAHRALEALALRCEAVAKGAAFVQALFPDDILEASWLLITFQLLPLRSGSQSTRRQVWCGSPPASHRKRSPLQGNEPSPRQVSIPVSSAYDFCASSCALVLVVPWC